MGRSSQPSHRPDGPRATDDSNAADRALLAERRRIQDEYARRRREVDAALYRPDDPAELVATHDRERIAEALLERLGCLPGPGSRCVEIGVGQRGWLPAFSRWGIPPEQQLGLDLDLLRLQRGRAERPVVRWLVADGAVLPLRSESVHLAVTSTVFSSILDREVQRRVAAEIERVLAPGGALVCYDLRVDNPRNPAVRRVSVGDLRQLFPNLSGGSRSTTLAPPLARRLLAAGGPGRMAAAALGAVPPLRTHLLSVLRRD